MFAQHQIVLHYVLFDPVCQANVVQPLHAPWLACAYFGGVHAEGTADQYSAADAAACRVMYIMCLAMPAQTDTDIMV